MSSLNRATILGNLGRDPEVRTTQAGKKIVSLSVGTSERWTDRSSGERQERTEWHRVTIMNDRIAETAERYLSKGRQVLIEGQIQTRKFQDQNGQDRWVTEIVVGQFNGNLVLIGGGNRDEQDEPAPQPPRGQRQAGGGRSAPRQSPTAELDDDIPFAPCVEV